MVCARVEASRGRRLYVYGIYYRGSIKIYIYDQTLMIEQIRSYSFLIGPIEMAQLISII